MKKHSRDLILFMTLGDGHLNKNGYLSIRHSTKQKEYLEWKNSLLKDSGVNTTGVYKVSNGGYGGYEFRTYNQDYIKLLRGRLYNPSKNIANRKFLDKFTPLGLAIWYMDDGSISTQYRGDKPYRSLLTISTCISKEENQVLIDYIQEKWGVKFGQRKMKNHFALVCSTKEARKFLKIVEPYVKQVECMTYKLNVKSN